MTPLDQDRDTLHIRAGSDLREPLRAAGFGGDFFEVSDTYCVGPVPYGDDLLSIRARFLARFSGRPAVTIHADLTRQQDELANAGGRHERIVLWFEHDVHCQLALARVLASFHGQARPATLDIICADRFLTDFPLEALRELWTHRAGVTEEQLRLGVEVWTALRAASPEALHAIASTGTPALPLMAPALRRLLQELPWTADGLGLLQRLVSQAEAAGARTLSDMFAFVRRNDPLAFATDLMVKAVMDDPTPAERWVGGVRIAVDAPPWRWDAELDAPVLNKA